MRATQAVVPAADEQRRGDQCAGEVLLHAEGERHPPWQAAAAKSGHRLDHQAGRELKPAEQQQTRRTLCGVHRRSVLVKQSAGLAVGQWHTDDEQNSQRDGEHDGQRTGHREAAA